MYRLAEHMKMYTKKGSLQPKTFSIEWKIERFFADCSKIGDSYRSPAYPIEYAGKTTKWYLEVFPMGENGKDKNNVSLYLCFQGDNDSEVVVDYQFSVVSEIKSLSKERKAQTFKGRYNHQREDLVEQSVLKDTRNGALINDTLAILCKITFHPKVQDVSQSFHGYDECLYNIEKYNEDTSIFGATSNVTFNVQGKKISLHKEILMCRNSVFKAMFEHDMKEKEGSIVDITDVDYGIMKELFRFIYMGKVENIEKIAEDLLIAADKYAVVELKALCEITLYNNLTIDNAIDCLKLTDMCDTLYLKKLAIKFVIDNLKNIVQNSNFKRAIIGLDQGLVCEIMEAVAEKI